MKIAFLIPHLIFKDVHWPKDVGGIPKSFSKLKLKTYLIVWRYESKIRNTTINIIETTQFVDGKNEAFKCTSFRCSLQLAIKIYKYLLGKKINAVIAEHITILNIIILALSRIFGFVTGKESVLINKLDLNPDFVYEYSVMHKLKLIIGLFLSLLITDYVIVESTCAYNRILEVTPFITFLKHKIVIIPNGYSKDYFHECGCVEKNNVIISVGRISREKGYDILIKAFAKISREYPDWRLEIIGSIDDPLYLNELENLIRKFCLKDRVMITDFVEPSDIWVKYCQASIYVMSSRKEGSPISRIEAMAYGIPVITTTAGCGEELRSRNSIVIRIDDEEGLARALSTLIRDPSLRSFISLSQKRELVSWDEVAWRIFGLIINKLRVRYEHD